MATVGGASTFDQKTRARVEEFDVFLTPVTICVRMTERKRGDIRGILTTTGNRQKSQIDKVYIKLSTISDLSIPNCPQKNIKLNRMNKNNQKYVLDGGDSSWDSAF